MADAMDLEVEVDVVEDTEAVDELRQALEAADEVAALTPDAAVEAYTRIISINARVDDSALKVKEEALYRLTKLYVKERRFDAVMDLLKNANPLFVEIPKAKTAKIVRTIIEIVSAVPDAIEVQIGLCRQVVSWCEAEKRTFLRQRIQSKLAALLFKSGEYQEAMAIISKLLRELKKLDDKQLLVETHLIEARIQHALRNLPKAKAALTTARTAGNAIYVVPLLQGELDNMSGTLHCEEGDYPTAYSYFLESFEGFSNVLGPTKNGDPRASTCLKHMMLCKILQGSAEEVSPIIAKWGVKYAGKDIEAMSAVAKAAKKRSLEDFDAASAAFGPQLNDDVLVQHHLAVLYENMLEANLNKIIEPFSCVEINRVAELIKLPIVKVEKKLSQMILDKKIKGTLDQGRGQLIIHDEEKDDLTIEHGLQVISNMGKVVDSLFKRAEKLVNNKLGQLAVPGQ
mmetsp:Transcript_4825/g.5797  ORF Transcript_4825/g.5797 Transcript_4825/m.5797 type:complete len:456 (-) Transcript_4825:200-1567(-)